MNVARALFLLMLLGSLSVTVVVLRTEQIRIGAHIAELQGQRRAMRRAAWTLQLEAGRLRSPEQIRDRVARWSLDLQEPGPPSDVPTDQRLALGP